MCSQILLSGFRLRRESRCEPRQLSSAPHPSEDGRLGSRKDESLFEILSRGVSLEDVRGTIAKDNNGSSLRETLARQDKVQEAEVATGIVGGDAAASHTRMAVEKAYGGGAAEQEKRGRGYRPPESRG